MNKYEIMFILRPNLEEDARNALLENLKGVLASNGGTVDTVNEWGLRELAYEIQDFRQGYYVIIDVTTPSENVMEFERLVRINANVIRFITIRK